MNKKLSLIFGITLILLVLPLISAIELNPFAVTKIVEKEIKVDMPEFLKEDFNEDYGVIRLSKTIFWIPTDKIAEYSLGKVETSLIDVYAEGKASLYIEGTLFDDINFKDIRGELTSLNEFKFYIQQDISYTEQEVATYKTECYTPKANLTEGDLTKQKEICQEIADTYKDVVKTRKEWVEYKYEKLPIGDYVWKIEGKRNINQNIDFIPVAREKSLEEWAWWNSSWSRKKAITVTEISGTSLKNYSLLYKIDYETEMNVDFSDLRFTNSTENGELEYLFKNVTNSIEAYIYVVIPSLTASSNTSIYMYYGNNGATVRDFDNELVYNSATKNIVTPYYNLTVDAKDQVNITFLKAGSTVIRHTSSGFNNAGTKGYQRSNSGSPTFTMNSNSSTDATFTLTWRMDAANQLIDMKEIWEVSALSPLIKVTYNGTYLNAGDLNSFLNWQSAATNIHYIKSNGAWDTSTNPQNEGGGAWTEDAELVGRNNTVGAWLDNRSNIYYGWATLTSLPANNVYSSWSYTGIYYNGGDSLIKYGTGLHINNQANSGVYPAYIFYSTDKNQVNQLLTPSYTTGSEESLAPTITLNAPADTYNSSSASVLFNTTVTSIFGVTNVSLYLDGTLNETNTSGINATDYLFTKTFSEGSHNWSIISCNSMGCQTSATRTFTIDTTYPQIVLNYPILVDYGYINQTLQLNFTATDLHLDKCIYNYNGTNISIAGCQTGVYNISNITLSNKKNVTFYVNDTFGNMNSTTISWDYKVFENSRTYDSTTFDTATANYQVNVTANSSLTGVNLEFNGSTYALTDQGSGIWNYTQQVPTSAVGNQSVVFKYQYGAGTINGYTSYQLVNSTILAFCNGTYTTRFLNVTFADENSLSAINASIPTSSWGYYLGNGTVNKTLTYSTASDNYNYSFCGTSGGLPLYVQPTVQYKQGTAYPQRIWIPSIQTYNSTMTTQVLYLLGSTDGLYVTFQVIDSSDATISGVEVNVSRVISGSTVQISSGTTDSGGLVTFWLNPDFQHTITFTKSGYTTYTTSLFPTQSSYTVTLGGTGTVTTDKTTGISYGIKPTDSFLTYFTVHDFEFSLGSTYWELDEFGFDLNWSNGTLIGSNSSTTSSGGTISIQDFNVSNGSAIVMTPYYTIDSVKYTLQPRFWYLQSSEGREFSLYQWFGDFTTYTSTGTSVLGFNDFGKLLLTALVLILLVGGLSQRYGLQSESAITGIIFSVIFFLEYTLEWIPLITTPLGTLPRGALTIVSAIILIATMIAGERR